MPSGRQYIFGFHVVVAVSLSGCVVHLLPQDYFLSSAMYVHLKFCCMALAQNRDNQGRKKLPWTHGAAPLEYEPPRGTSYDTYRYIYCHRERSWISECGKWGEISRTGADSDVVMYVGALFFVRATFSRSGTHRTHMTTTPLRESHEKMTLNNCLLAGALFELKSLLLVAVPACTT